MFFFFSLIASNPPAAYPDPDTSVREYLIPNGSVNLRKRYHCFLRATFEFVEKEFLSLGLDDKSSSTVKARHWREHLSSGDVRERLYSQIVAQATSVRTFVSFKSIVLMFR